MRIAFVSHSAGRGGAEKVLLELIDALSARGVECRCLLPRRGPLVRDLETRGIPTAIVRYGWWMGRNPSVWKRVRKTFRSLYAAPRAAALIRRWKCDVVYTNTITVCVGALAAKLIGRPHVWHIHEFGYADHRLAFHLGAWLSLGLVDRLSAACIVNSQAVAAAYSARVDPSKLYVVYYSVILPQPPATNDGPDDRPNTRPIRCVVVGALGQGKGQEDAILAIRELTRAGVPAHLDLVGNGKPEYVETLRRLVRDSDLEDRVRFVGYVDNPAPFMQAADCVLMCSRHEAFGRVTVEGMKLGKPVIGTSTGGTPEIVRDGETGLLYTPGDFRGLADRIGYLHAHPQVAQRMGRNGRCSAEERFTQGRFGGEVLSILARVGGTPSG